MFGIFSLGESGQDGLTGGPVRRSGFVSVQSFCAAKSEPSCSSEFAEGICVRHLDLCLFFLLPGTGAVGAAAAVAGAFIPSRTREVPRSVASAKICGLALNLAS